MAACVKSYLTFLPGGNLLVLKLLLVFMSYRCVEKMDMIFHLETVCEMKSDPSFKLTLQLSKTNTEVKIEKKEWGSKARNEEARLTSSLASSPWFSLATVSEQAKSFTLTCDQQYWWTYFLIRNREADVESGLVHTAGEGEGGMNWESSTNICTLSCTNGRCCVARGAQLGALWWPKWVGWGWMGGRLKRKGICVYLQLIRVVE